MVAPKFQGSQVFDGPREPLGYIQMTSLASAVPLTATIPAQAKLVLLQAETQSVRWRDDGTNPTASVGMLIAAGSMMIYTGNPSNLKVIETTASAKLNVSYYM